MKPEHQDKCHELIDSIASRLKVEVNRLYHSGGINPDLYDPGDYALAKILVTSAMLQAIDWYYPQHGRDREAMKNLTYF